MIAVVGAGGATGQQCVRKLLEEGTQVRAVVRSPEKYAGKFGTAEVVSGDVTEEASLASAFHGCAGVIFAASASTYRGRGGPYEVDFKGVEKCAAAAKTAGVARMVLVTSRFVHPSQRRNFVRIILNNIKYGLMDNKWAGEEVLRASGLDYTIVRPGGLKGTGEDAGDELHIVAGGPQADMGKERSIHRASVAAVVVEALRSEAAKGKTVEIVARAREATDSPFADSVRSLFADVPVDA